jgi:hypothetical protein
MDGWYFRWPSFQGDFKRYKTVARKARLTGALAAAASQLPSLWRPRAGGIAVETGNHQAMHELERPESLNELIATARIRFDALAAIGVLTQRQANSILHLLERGGGTLSPHDRLFRHNILRYLKKKADFVTVFAEMLQIDKHPAPPGPKSQRYAMLLRLAGKRPRVPFKPSNRDPSTTAKRRGAKTFILSLAPINTKSR